MPSQQTPAVWVEVTVGLHLGLALKRSLTGVPFLKLEVIFHPVKAVEGGRKAK